MGLLQTLRTWAVGDLETAAFFNSQIRDPLNGIQSAWTPYTPVWTGTTTNPAIGNGTLTGAYRRIGKTIEFRITLTAGSSTTFGSGVFQLTLPVPPLVGTEVFLIKYNDASAANHFLGLNYVTSASTLNLGVHNSTAGGAIAGVTPTVPFTWGASDTIRISGTYEAA